MTPPQESRRPDTRSPTPLCGCCTLIVSSFAGCLVALSLSLSPQISPPLSPSRAKLFHRRIHLPPFSRVRTKKKRSRVRTNHLSPTTHPLFRSTWTHIFPTPHQNLPLKNLEVSRTYSLKRYLTSFTFVFVCCALFRAGRSPPAAPPRPRPPPGKAPPGAQRTPGARCTTVPLPFISCACCVFPSFRVLVVCLWVRVFSSLGSTPFFFVVSTGRFRCSRGFRGLVSLRD